MRLVNVNVDQMRVFVIINNVGIKINGDVHVKSSLAKDYLTKNLFGILVIVIVNVRNYVRLDNIQIIKIVNAETNQLINYMKNVVKTLMEIK